MFFSELYEFLTYLGVPSFLRPVTFHCMYMPHFVYPFIRWTSGICCVVERTKRRDLGLRGSQPLRVGRWGLATLVLSLASALSRRTCSLHGRLGLLLRLEGADGCGSQSLTPKSSRDRPSEWQLLSRALTSSKREKSLYSS